MPSLLGTFLKMLNINTSEKIKLTHEDRIGHVEQILKNAVTMISIMQVRVGWRQ